MLKLKTHAPGASCRPLLVCAALLAAAPGSFALAPGDPPGVKSEAFDQPPSWEGFRNVLVPAAPKKVTQDFGWSTTQHASDSPGEIGGLVARSTTPAHYGRSIGGESLKGRLTASGTIALLRSEGGSGVFLGWFNSRQQGFRPVNFLGLRLDAEQRQATVHLDYTTATWKAGGLNTGARIAPDGKRHAWSLAYDPSAAGGAGSITLTLDGAQHVLQLEAGHQAEGARFDRFGMFNQQTPGGALVVYCGNLEVDGKKVSLAKNPQWDGQGNQKSFDDYEPNDSQNFAYYPSRYAGGVGSGEVGGLFWRTEPESEAYGYYADRIYRLGTADALTASGKIAITRAASDSGMYFGWFNSTLFKGAPRATDAKDEVVPSGLLGVMIEGPSRAGHYFRPIYTTTGGTRDLPAEGPLIRPDGKSRTFTIAYDPTGDGALRVTLDGAPVELKLPPGHRALGAPFDRFGMLTMRRGGHYAAVFLDDLKYTTGK